MANSKYEADNGEIYQIRLGAATLAAAGAPPAGAVSSSIRVKVSKSNREFGLRPRGVVLSRPQNPGPTDKIFRKFLPVLTPAAYNSAGFANQASITVGGVVWTVINRINEDA
jgi:hypothetical protein